VLATATQADSNESFGGLVALFIFVTFPVFAYVLYYVGQNMFSHESTAGTLITASVPNSRFYLYIIKALRQSSRGLGAGNILNALALDKNYSHYFDFPIDHFIDDYYFNTKKSKSVLTARSLEEVLSNSMGSRRIQIQGWSKDCNGCSIVVQDENDGIRVLALPVNNTIEVSQHHSQVTNKTLTTDAHATYSRIECELDKLISESDQSSYRFDTFLAQFPTHIATIGDHYFDSDVLQILFHHPGLISGDSDFDHICHNVLKTDEANELYDKGAAELIRFCSQSPSCEMIKLICAVLLRVNDTLKIIQ